MRTAAFFLLPLTKNQIDFHCTFFVSGNIRQIRVLLGGLVAPWLWDVGSFENPGGQVLMFWV